MNASTGWYETFFRGYDPALGRFGQVDPMASASASQTPYSFGFNNPVLFNDPNGDYPLEVQIDKEHHGGGAQYDYESGTLYQTFGPHQYGQHFYGAGSVHDWFRPYASIERNARVMSRDAFNSYYNIKNDQDRADVANKASTKVYDGKQLYNPWIGREVGHNVFTGDWMDATGAEAMALITNQGDRFITRVAQQGCSKCEELARAYNEFEKDMGVANTMFWDWLLGDGAETRSFYNDHVAANMKNAWRVNEARKFFYNKYKDATDYKGASVTNYQGDFGIEGLLRAGFDPIEQFVGSYTVNIYASPNG
ncbi:MAG TPA: RHS repeat-associated core domain-containing protein, partial [Chryseosolibacter sp.]